jgi:hypothetical protein
VPALPFPLRILTVEFAAEAPEATLIVWATVFTPVPSPIVLPPVPLPIATVVAELELPMVWVVPEVAKFTPTMPPFESTEATVAESESMKLMASTPALSPILMLIDPELPAIMRGVSMEVTNTVASARLQVMSLPDPVVMIWSVVPRTLILLAVGEMAPPLSPVRVFKSELEEFVAAHVPSPRV